MAINFYLNDITSANKINANTNSTFTEKAGSFNVGTIELEWNATENALLPFTKLYIEETESDTIWCFVISQDDVSVVKKGLTTTYLHTLTVTQNTHELGQHLLRNTRFSQPYDYQRKYTKQTLFANAITYTRTGDVIFTQSEQRNYLNFSYSRNSDASLIANYSWDFTGRKKVSSAYFIPSHFCNVFDRFTDTSSSQVVEHRTTSYENNFITSLTFKLVNVNDATDYKTFVVSTQQWNTRQYLSASDVTWLKGKNVYCQMVSGTPIAVTGLQANYEGTAYTIAGFIKIEFVFNTYYYSLWDVLDTINKQYVKKYDDASLPNLYLMPGKNTTKGALLDRTMAPELDFTETDVFSAVAQTLSYIDAFPVLKDDGTLDFVYLNDLSDEEIAILKLTDKKTSLSEENFANRLVSTYQNGKINAPIQYPAKRVFKSLGSTTYGVVSNYNDYWFILDKKIDYVDKLYIKLNDLAFHFVADNFDDPQGFLQNRRLEYTGMIHPNMADGVDISSRVFEKSIYDALPDGYATDNTLNRNNALYYVKGDNKIYAGITDEITQSTTTKDVLEYAITKSLNYDYDVDGFIITYATNFKQTTSFNCLYHPILDGRVAQESSTNKYEGETTVSQVNRGVELNRMGNNMQGLIAKLGNEAKSFSMPITELKDKVKIGTLWKDQNGSNWIVSQTTTSFLTNSNKVIVNATFTKNFNMLAQFTKLNQEKRFYEISTNLTSKGYETINEFVYFTAQDISVDTLSNKIAMQKKGFEFVVKATLQGTIGLTTDPTYIYPMEFVRLSAYEQVGSSAVETYIPIVTYGCGNQVCYEMGFDSSIDAGNRLVISDSKYIGQTCLYTAKSGFADILTFKGVLIKNYATMNRNFPNVQGSTLTNYCFELTNYEYYKKPNEIVHLNYSLCFLPYFTKTSDELGTPIYKYEEIYFGDTFVNENGSIPNNKFVDVVNKKVHLWLCNYKFSIIDNIVDSTEATDYGEISVNINEQTYNATQGFYGTIEIRDITTSNLISTGNYKSWCLTDEEGNIYIAVNVDSTQYTKLKYFTSRNRKV